MKKNSISVFVFTIFMGACSTKSLYNSIQNDEKRKCQKLPSSEQGACLNAQSQSFEDYHRERQKLLENRSD